MSQNSYSQLLLMGFFDRLINAFSKLLDGTPRLQFDDTEIQTSVCNYPKSLAGNYGKSINDIAENIHHAYTTANYKEFTIGVIGDFTVGKSSFINGILGDRLLPVSTNPTTAVITKIKYGRKPKVIIRYKDGKEEEMTYETYMNFSSFSLRDFQERINRGDIQRFKDVSDAIMYVRSDFLKDNNLCIVDTLGLSAHESDNNKTISSIRDSIATIYLCSERGLSDKDVEFISTYLSPENDNFFLCINRIDLVRKTERNDVSQLVKMKMDSILCKSRQAKDFPLSRIYQVSSLYQEFANGFIEHEDWHEGVNYHECSGFAEIMKDVCQYVKVNADVARETAINKQLKIARTQLVELMTLRKSELENQLSSNNSTILRLKDIVREHTKYITYINTLFETLFNTLYSFSNNIYDEFCHSVNSGWEEKVNNTFINQVSFGFGDYLTLEKNLMVLKLNVFKSMTDDRFAQVKSLSPFVDLTIQYLKDNLQRIIKDLEWKIRSKIETFAVQKKLTNFFDMGANFNTDADSSVERSDVVFAMYRAVALAAVESTWMKNNNRCVKMFNAAKTESLKTVEKSLGDSLKQFYVNIQHYLKAYNKRAVEFNTNEVDALAQQVNRLEQKNSSVRKQMEHELTYFNSVINLLNKLLLSDFQNQVA